MKMKTIKLVLNLLMEDACQILCQYFFFEKVLLEKSVFVYVNAGVVLFSAAWNFKIVAKAYCRANVYGADLGDKIAVGLFVVLILNPVLRMIGLVHQTHRYGSLVRAGCVAYSFKSRVNCFT